VSAIMYWTICS